MKAIILLSVLLSSEAFGLVEFAKVNGASITDMDVRVVLSSMNDIQQRKLVRNNDSKVQLVDQLVSQELLYQAAVKNQMDKNPMIAKEMETLKKRYLAQKYLEGKLKKEMTLGNLKRYFRKNAKLFDGSKAHASHILLHDMATAKKVYAMARNKKNKFPDLALKYSKDPSVKQNNGDLGTFTRDQMVPAFTDAVFAMRPGQIKGPVRSPFGYHIIKVYEIKKGKIPSFSAVEMKVRDRYRMEKTQQILNGIKKTAKVSINKNAISKFNR